MMMPASRYKDKQRMSAVGQIKTQSLKTRVLASIFPLVKWYTPVRQSGSKSTA